MTQITIDIEKLGEVVAKHLQETVKEKSPFIDSKECAELLKIGNHKSFTQYTASLPSFPARIELDTTRRTERKKLLWVRKEVEEWVLLHQRKKKA